MTAPEPSDPPAPLTLVVHDGRGAVVRVAAGTPESLVGLRRRERLIVPHDGPVPPDPAAHYVDLSDPAVPRLADRPPLPALDRTEIPADGAAEAVLEGLPDGASVRVDGVPREVRDGRFALAATMPGDYVVEAEAWPFLDYRAVVRAVPAGPSRRRRRSPPGTTLAAKDLAPLRAAAAARVDQEAEAARQAFITPGDGQQLEYERVAEEAAAVLARPPGSGEPAPGSFPFLEAGRADPARPLAREAATVLDRRGAWLAAGAAIRRLRLGAKAAVAAARDPAAVEAAVSSVPWPRP